MSIRISGASSNIFIGAKDKKSRIIQNIGIILGTHKGSVPLFRDFGISSEALHRPINIARLQLVYQIKEAIEQYEPNVSVLNVDFETSGNDANSLIPIVEVEFLNE